MRVRAKLIASLCIFALIMAATIYYALYQEYLLYDEVKAQQTKQRVIAIRNQLEGFLDATKNTAELLAVSDNIKTSLKERNHKSSLGLLKSFSQNSEVNLINIYNHKGLLFSSVEDPSLSDIQDGFYFFIQRVLNAKSTRSLMLSVDGRSYLLTARPIKDNQKIIGVVTCGIQINNAFVKQLASKNNVEIQFYLNQNMIASSNPDILKHQQEHFKTTHINLSRLFDIHHRDYLRVQVSENNSALNAEFYKSVQNTLLGTIPLAVLAFLIVLQVVARLATRLSRLSELTKRLATGELDISYQAETGEDEIASLHRDFQSMHQVLKRKTEDLDQRNNDLEKSNIDLKKAKYLADKASRSKSQFLANMSHEIRTPMNGIMGMADLLLHSGVEKKQRSQLQIIINSAKSLLTIINDILDFSKIEAGKLEVEKVSFNLHKTIEEVIALFIHASEAKNIELNFVIDSQIDPNVIGDPARLRQILNNLIGNSIKFTNDGCVTLFVNKNPGSQAQEVRFEMVDTGAGISRQNLDKIFCAFSQEDGTVTRKFGGTGLGLTISKQLCELMGGSMSVSSEVDKGSNFTFILPLKANPTTDSLPIKQNVFTFVCTPSQIPADSISQLLSYYQLPFEVYGNVDIQDQVKEKSKQYEEIYVFIDSAIVNINNNCFWDLANQIEADVSFILLRPLNHRQIDAMEFPPSTIAQLIKPIRPTELSDLYIDHIKNMNADNQDLVDHELELPQFNLDVLLVQSEVVSQRITSGLLQLLGCYSDLAKNDKQALSMLSKRSYNALIIDLNAIMSPSILRTIQQNLSERQQALVPIFIIDDGRSHQLNMDLISGMLKRPFHIKDIINLFGHWQNKQKQPTPTPAAIEHIHEKNPILDRQTLESMRALQMPGRPDIVTELIKLYLRDSAVCIENLEKAIEARDMVAAKHCAHALKSSSGNVGAVMLSDLCYQLESLPYQSVTPEVKELSEQIVEAHRLACDALNQLKAVTA